MNDDELQKVPRWTWRVLVIISLTLAISIWVATKPEKREGVNTTTPQPRAAVATQIYPNYTFSEGVNEIRVPLLPAHQLLPREAGGWVITPIGSRGRFDHDVPIVVENIDGHRKNVKPDEVVWLDVKPGNGLLRFYGEEGKFVTISIKRDFY